MMPIILKDHSWSQTEDTLCIRVPMKGIRADKTSLISSDNYIRVYYPPFYFELFLWGEVDETKGKCTLNENDAQVVFELPKKSSYSVPQPSGDNDNENEVNASGDGDSEQLNNDKNFEWPCLELTGLNRFQKQEIRKRACELSQQRAQMEIQEVLEKRQQNKHMTVHEQIRLDQEARERVSSIKKSESESFMAGTGVADGDGDQWGQEGFEKVASEDRMSYMRNDKAVAYRGTKDKTFTEARISPAPVPVRQGGSIKVSFTPREFPTPSRESTTHLEEEWLAKQLEARRRN